MILFCVFGYFVVGNVEEGGENEFTCIKRRKKKGEKLGDFPLPSNSMLTKEPKSKVHISMTC